METSAKEADNVEKLFMEIAHALIEQAKVREPVSKYEGSPGQALNLNNRPQTASTENCCSRLL
jgi:hypothetical protein